jgi:hypothetical protein
MRDLKIADIEIVVGENRASDRAYENGAVLGAEIVNRLGDHFMNVAVAATGTIMRRQFVAWFSIKLPIETPGSLKGLCGHLSPRLL